MNKNERTALYSQLTSLGMFYGVEKGNTKGKQSVCRGCNLFMSKGGNLRFRHLVCNSKCYAPKITTDTCGRWHPECLVAMQESNPERFVFTNPEFKPIKAAWQLAGFDELSHEDQNLILRVLDGKTGVVTKRRLTASGLSRKLSFTGTTPSINPVADTAPVLKDSASLPKASPAVEDRILPKIILRSPSKLNSEIKREAIPSYALKSAEEAIHNVAKSATAIGVAPAINGHHTASPKKTTSNIFKPVLISADSPNKSLASKSPVKVLQGMPVNPIASNVIASGTTPAENLLNLKSLKNGAEFAYNTHTPSNTLAQPKSPKKSPILAQPRLSADLSLAASEIPTSKRALQSPSDDAVEKKIKTDGIN